MSETFDCGKSRLETVFCSIYNGIVGHDLRGTRSPKDASLGSHSVPILIFD